MELTRLATKGASMPPTLEIIEPVPMADDRSGVGNNSAVNTQVMLKGKLIRNAPSIASPAISNAASKTM